MRMVLGVHLSFWTCLYVQIAMMNQMMAMAALDPSFRDGTPTVDPELVELIKVDDRIAKYHEEFAKEGRQVFHSFPRLSW